MEYFDILDDQGNITGKKATREEAHKKGLWHRIAHIWILNSRGEIIIQKRTPEKDSYPNMWGMSCEGHISAGQKSLEGALRELKEELGLDLGKDQITLAFSYRRSAKHFDFIGNHFIDVYIIKQDIELSKLKIQKEEVSEIKWIKLEDYLDSVKNDKSFRDYPGELEKLSLISKQF